MEINDIKNEIDKIKLDIEIPADDSNPTQNSLEEGKWGGILNNKTFKSFISNFSLLKNSLSNLVLKLSETIKKHTDRLSEVERKISEIKGNNNNNNSLQTEIDKLKQEDTKIKNKLDNLPIKEENSTIIIGDKTKPIDIIGSGESLLYNGKQIKGGGSSSDENTLQSFQTLKSYKGIYFYTKIPKEILAGDKSINEYDELYTKETGNIFKTVGRNDESYYVFDTNLDELIKNLFIIQQGFKDTDLIKLDYQTKLLKFNSNITSEYKNNYNKFLDSINEGSPILDYVSLHVDKSFKHNDPSKSYGNLTGSDWFNSGESSYNNIPLFKKIVDRGNKRKLFICIHLVADNKFFGGSRRLSSVLGIHNENKALEYILLNGNDKSSFHETGIILEFMWKNITKYYIKDRVEKEKD